MIQHLGAFGAKKDQKAAEKKFWSTPAPGTFSFFRCAPALNTSTKALVIFKPAESLGDSLET